MLYEIYQNKIQKTARVLAKIVRLLPLIIVCVVTVSGATTALLAFKGTVTKIECSPEVEYGQSVQYSAQAF